jgi:hypothetical protein
VIVCLRDPADWEETLRVRRVPRDKILAVSGIFVRAAEGVQSYSGLPVFDAVLAEDRQTLVEQLLRSSGYR